MRQESEVLRVDKVDKYFGKHAAVSALSFSVEAGQVVGLLGPNGSGKTTTLHMLVGLLEPSAGSIAIDGGSPQDLDVRRRIGIVPDDLPLPAALTGVEFLDLHEQLRGRVDARLRDELLELFSLSRHLHRPVGEYSHGMKRKIQMVAGVSHRPTLLILDEPHRGLDPESSVILRELLSSLSSEGTAILVATHDLTRAGRETDKVVIISNGERLIFDTPDEVCRQSHSPDLEQAFLRLTGLDRSMTDARNRLAEILGSQDPEDLDIDEAHQENGAPA